MKTALSLVLKVIALTVVLFICFAVAGTVLGLESPSQAPEQAGAAAGTLLLVCLLNTLVLTHIILRSRWSGWRLMATVFFVYYGVTTFMSQIESAVFITRLPPGVLPRLFLMGLLIAAPFSVLSVLILGKRKSGAAPSEPHERLVMPAGEWAWKLATIAFAYLILYFTFGYFIAWQNPVVRAYYGGIDPDGFFSHMATVFSDTFWLIPFQILRALFWVALALPVVRMMKGPWQETALAVALLFAVVMNTQLLLPNPYMPEAVRITHLIETASSNFIFGFLVGWLLTHRHAFAGVPVPQNEAGG